MRRRVMRYAMKELIICQRQVQKIRQVASGGVLPYVGRSRIGRLVTGLNAIIDQVEDHHAEGLVHQTERLQSIAKTICQPSEPLDSRWREGWSELLTELDKLESVLAAATNA